MAVVSTSMFPVRSYEQRSDGAVGHTVFLQWFQETAFAASAALGFDQTWYVKEGATWVMRSVDVEFLGAARYGDQIEARTWVSDYRRVRSHREYEARGVETGELLARARVDWVYLDAEKLMPRRLAPEWMALFEPDGHTALEPFVWPDLSRGKPLGHYEATRRVQQYELDQMNHVNNAIYLNWIEQQAYEAWRAWGQAPATLNLKRHLIEYRQPAKGDDTLQLVSDAAQIDSLVVWNHRIVHDGTVLVQANSLI